MTLEMAAGNDESSIYHYLDVIFFAIYIVEFAMKVFAERKYYWKSGFNQFDFILLSVSAFQFIMTNVGSSSTNLSFLRVLRALRGLRLLRSVSFVRQLQVLMSALIKTVRSSVSDLLILLLLLLFLFGVIGYYFFGAEDTGSSYFKSLDLSMFALADWVTVGSSHLSKLKGKMDGWTDIVDDLDQQGYGGGRWFAVIFVIIGGLIYTNLFVAIVIQVCDI